MGWERLFYVIIDLFNVCLSQRDCKYLLNQKSISEGGYCRQAFYRVLGRKTGICWPALDSWMMGVGLLGGGNSAYVGVEAEACTWSSWKINQPRLVSMRPGNKEQGWRGASKAGVSSLDFFHCLPLLGSLLLFSHLGPLGAQCQGGEGLWVISPIHTCPVVHCSQGQRENPPSSWIPETIWALEIIIRGSHRLH